MHRLKEYVHRLHNSNVQYRVLAIAILIDRALDGESRKHMP